MHLFFFQPVQNILSFSDNRKFFILDAYICINMDFLSFLFHFYADYYANHFNFYLFIFCKPFLKSLICYNIVSVLSFGSFFGLEACEISAPQPRFELLPPALEGKVLTAGLPRKPLYVFSK